MSTHSIGIDAPDLNNSAMVHRGAGHFETGCVKCHGSPVRPQSPIVAAMTPRPPALSTAVPHWETRELFYIVKHGVKQKVPSCTGCHGPDRSDSYPLLSGQPSSYLAKLTLFKRRDRGGTEQQHLMHPATDRITEKQIQAVAEYFAERE